MVSHQEPRSRAIRFVEVVAVLVIVAVVVLLAVPVLVGGRNNNAERNTPSSLKTLASAEAHFRANDCDGNRVNDYWTADVKGLYTMTSAAVAGATPNSTTDPSIKLMELSIASADADVTFHPAGGENLALSSFAVVSTRSGYWYAAMRSDPSARLPAYAQDTKGTPPMGLCHNESRFGFLTFPDSQSEGKYVFIVNENNVVYRRATTGAFRLGTSQPPGLASVPSVYLNCPDAMTLKSHWAPLDKLR